MVDLDLSSRVAVFAGLCAVAIGCGSEPRAETEPTGDTGSGDDGDASITTLTSSLTSGVDPSITSDATTDDDVEPDTTNGVVDTTMGESTTDPDPTSSSSTTDDDGSTTTGDRSVTIYDIQQGVVPAGTAVDVTGIVVSGTANTGFFAQEIAGGPYSGIFVFGGSAPAVVIGDEVDVSGIVGEYMGMTQINVTMGGAVNPTGVSDIALQPDLPALSDYAAEATAEPWESVFVRAEGTPLAVVELPGFSEFVVSDGTDAVRIDNYLYNALNDGIAFPGLGLESSFTAIQGPLNFSFGNYMIAPRSAADLEGYLGPPPPTWTAVAALGPGDLVITEIMYNPTCANDDCEWIEIFNAFTNEVNVNGLQIQDSALGATCSINVDLIVPTGGYLWIATDDMPGWTYSTPPHVFASGTCPSFNNSGSDSAVIRNAAGIIDQTAAYAGVSTYPGISWKLAPTSIDAVANDNAGNWCYSTIVFDSPGGTDERGSPGAENEAACAP